MSDSIGTQRTIKNAWKLYFSKSRQRFNRLSLNGVDMYAIAAKVEQASTKDIPILTLSFYIMPEYETLEIVPVP